MMAFDSRQMLQSLAASARGFGQGLNSQTFTAAPQTGFEGLGLGGGFAEQNNQALQRQRLAQQQAEALEQQRAIQNQQAAARTGIAQGNLGVARSNLGVAQGLASIKSDENKREQRDSDREQDLLNNLSAFSQGGTAPPQTAPPPPQTPGPQSQVAPPQQGPLAAPLPPQTQQGPLAAQQPQQAPQGPIMSDAGPQGPAQAPGAQFASLQQQQQPQGLEQPKTQGRVAPEIAARSIPDQRLAQVAQPVPHPDPLARVAKAQEPTFMGMNRQQAGEFVRIKAMLGDAQAGAYLKNIQDQKNRMAERGTLSQKDKYAVEDRMHDDFRNRINVNKYSEADALYNGMLETVNDPSGQSDIDLVFATANILDPGSVVREGEAKTVFDSGGAGSWAQSWAGWLQSGNRLDAKDREALLRVADRRVRAYRVPAQRAALKAQKLAKRRGLTPGGVVRADYSGENHRAPILAADMSPEVQSIRQDTTNKPPMTPGPGKKKAAQTPTEESAAVEAFKAFMAKRRQERKRQQ